jgi:hypothetical protein
MPYIVENVRSFRLLTEAMGECSVLNGVLKTLSFQDGFSPEEMAEIDRLHDETITMLEHLRSIRNSMGVFTHG